MDKQNISKNINDISLKEESINSDIKEIITANKNFEAIYLNLLNSKEIKIPKINGVYNFLIFFDFIFNKISSDNGPKEELSNKNKIMDLLIEELLNNIEEIKEKKYQEQLGKYFYDINFFNSFLDKLIKKQDISTFKEKFLIVSTVSINIIIIIFIILDDSNAFKR
jgi:hypothetical protein